MKTAKRFAMLAGLALALMAVLSFTGCSKKDEIAKVAPESDFEFELSDDGTFIAITNYKGNAKNLVIPETIQGVPVEAIKGFRENKKIKSVVIPPSVKVIGGGAFVYCESLEKVTLPEELFCIAGHAFSYTGLTSVTLPKSLEYLAEAFRMCDNLAEINIPDDAAFLLKNATECAAVLDEIFLDESGVVDTGDEIFSGSIIDESVALQKELREIKCIDAESAFEYYSKAEEKYIKYIHWIN